jgi:hypothetical protein
MGMAPIAVGADTHSSIIIIIKISQSIFNFVIITIGGIMGMAPIAVGAAAAKIQKQTPLSFAEKNRLKEQIPKLPVDYLGG